MRPGWHYTKLTRRPECRLCKTVWLYGPASEKTGGAQLSARTYTRQGRGPLNSPSRGEHHARAGALDERPQQPHPKGLEEVPLGLGVVQHAVDIQEDDRRGPRGGWRPTAGVLHVALRAGHGHAADDARAPRCAQLLGQVWVAPRRAPSFQ